MNALGSFAEELVLKAGYPSVPSALCNSHYLGRAGLGEAVEEGGTDVKPSSLTIEGPGHKAFAEELQAFHLCLDETSLVVAPSLPPKGPSKMAGGS